MPERSGWSKIDWAARGVIDPINHLAAVGIEHLDFEPGCAARRYVSQRGLIPDGIGCCEVPADFLITTHLCLFVGHHAPRVWNRCLCALNISRTPASSWSGRCTMWDAPGAVTAVPCSPRSRMWSARLWRCERRQRRQVAA